MSDPGFVGATAAEIDRLVVGGHEAAGAYVPKAGAVAPPATQSLLLNTAAIVLLARPITRDDVMRVLTYTPPSFVHALVDDSVSQGIVVEGAGDLRLTEAGQQTAAALIEVQEVAVGDLWAEAATAVETVIDVAAPLVEHASSLPPADDPPAFPLFVGVHDRPTPAGRALRLITAMRYWRADAHRAAMCAAGLKPGEAHALNVLWDASRRVERVGQGFPEAGARSVAALEGRGLAGRGAITPEGVALRERIEADTDARTAPMYERLDDPTAERFLPALRAVPS